MTDTYEKTSPQLICSNARSVARDFRERYGDQFARDEKKLAMMAKLDSLPDDAVVEEIDAITMNPEFFMGSMVLECSACNRKPGLLVRVGHPPDHDSETAWLCRDCLVEALALADSVS